MKNGIVFIWSEKEILGKLIHIMEEKGFFYIENMAIALIDSSRIDEYMINNASDPSQATATAKNSSDSKKGRPKSKKRADSPCLSDTSTTDSGTKQAKNGGNKNVSAFEEELNNEFFLHNLDKYHGLEANQLFF